MKRAIAAAARLPLMLRLIYLRFVLASDEAYVRTLKRERIASAEEIDRFEKRIQMLRVAVAVDEAKLSPLQG